MEGTRKILLAVDSSEQAALAFQYYVNLLHKPENECLLLHCPEMSHMTNKLMKSGKQCDDEWKKAWAEEEKKWKGLQEKYENLLKENEINGKFEVQPTSKPGEAIVKVAEDRHVAMIVMGTRGLGSIRRTIMGSVSDFVVHHGHCPVVVYRACKGAKK